MMKKNRLSFVTTFGLMLAVLGLISVSSTYAKYTSTLTGTDTAKVAKWDWTIGDAVLKNGVDEFTLSLFDTVKGYGDGDETTGDDADVVDGAIIAPGTSGEFTINVKNDSDVDATYEVSFSLSKSDELSVMPNIKFSVDGSTWGDISTLNVDATEIESGANTTIPVYWMWDYVGTDANDTQLGIDAANNVDARDVTVDATLVVTQVN